MQLLQLQKKNMQKKWAVGGGEGEGWFTAASVPSKPEEATFYD